MNKKFLPYGRHLIDDDDISAVTAVLKGDFLTTGPSVEAFEEALAKHTNARHAVACTSGTTALHLAALALDLGPGDTVVVPSITFLATANASRYVGADVIFSDVDPNTGLMRPDDFLDAIKRSPTKIKAVFPVHLAGQSPDLPGIAEIARAKGISIVEDACHALGSTYWAIDKNEQVGACSHSDMATFSFHPVKTIAMGEGGGITTNDDALSKRLKKLCSHSIVRESGEYINTELALDDKGSSNPWYYEMQELGFNFRASDIHCALGLSQLKKLNKYAARRRKLAALYDKILAPQAPAIRPIERMAGCNPAWHLYVILVDFKKTRISRAELICRLYDEGIGTQVHYIPVHKQPYYQNLYGDVSLHGAEQYYEQCLSLPLFPGMTEADVERVARKLNIIINGD